MVGKLNGVCRRALEAAAGLCMSRTNYNVELEHFLLKLIETPDSDFLRIFKQYEVDSSVVVRELTRALDKLKTGNARAPELAIDIIDGIREAWVMTSLHYQAHRIRSGSLLAALLTDRNLSRRVLESCPSLKKVLGEQLAENLYVIVKGTAEDQTEVGDTPSPPGGTRPTRRRQQDAGARSLHAQPHRSRQESEIDPVIGRDFEIRQVIDILTRRRQTTRF